MKTILKVGICGTLLGVSSSHADITLQQAYELAQLIKLDLKTDEKGLVRCPWKQTLTIKISKESPAAWVSCSGDGDGPGEVVVGLRQVK